MINRELKIIKRPHFGYQVVNKNGEAELGTWLIAEFSWKVDAKFFVKKMTKRIKRLKEIAKKEAEIKQ